MKVQVRHSRSNKLLCTLELKPNSTILDAKKAYHQKFPKYYPDRQQWKNSVEKGVKALKDEDALEKIGIKDDGVLYFKDLGPQIGWITVFLCEYSGPLLAYLLFYFRPPFIYGEAGSSPIIPYVHIAAACWSFHYAKRLLETVFIHRFSHSTMPIANLFKNCSYYWGFAAFVSYFTNHPLYTPPMFGAPQVYTGLALFVIGELGNYSIHVALRDLRSPGTRERRIPYPTSNPLTILFNFVSCPNYTYEFVSWLGFTIMTQSIPALLFTLAGMYQMSVWALGKHRNYRKEFSKYPRGRKAILPFIL